MRAGRLRHQVTIQKNEISRDDFGSVINKWVDVATVWAEVKAISGRERMASGAVFSEATVRIWLRYRADVTTANSITYHGANTRGTAFSIMAVIPDSKHTRLELLCKGGVFR
ncbi:phage head closure protein [Photorhabdus temperata]|uniref:Phage head-tail adaptor, putative, SPP1 family n=2 Tax=Photorhabdus temperata TaxID=574560 RepID=A0A081RSR7_PHOTE|nr:phage head closure protein [Photorhabdus temperata]ERT11882.1 head-tail adaptor protein [Photorhabdus temperata J3]KER01720.1 phage head-tail adaptor, putative, SPP1 family [Photorhabdus temperata subsp. temperata Meg1]MCT8348788.1 phage head closure protein [Photorhabdus temperata]